MWELIISIFGLFLAFMAIYYPIKYKKEIFICFLKPTHRKQVNKAICLYFEKISDEQRIPPDHLKKSLKLKNSAKSVRDFKKRVKKQKESVHLPLIAKTQGDVVGFLKAIYIPEQNCVFIAYLISRNFNEITSTTITKKMLDKLVKCIKGINEIEIIAFEIVEEKDNIHIAKERLFKHTARDSGMICKYIDTLYYVPEVCAFDEGDCEFYKARLFYINLKQNIEVLTKKNVLRLIEDIYRKIYTESYRVSEPSLVEEHTEFVNLLLMEIKEKTPEVVYLK